MGDIAVAAERFGETAVAGHRVLMTLEEIEAVNQAPPGETVSYTASLVSQGKYRFYTLTMPSDVLAENCTVDTRIENPIKGFQRRLDERRAQDIADYIDSGFGTIPDQLFCQLNPKRTSSIPAPREHLASRRTRERF